MLYSASLRNFTYTHTPAIHTQKNFSKINSLELHTKYNTLKFLNRRNFRIANTLQEYYR